MQCVDRSLCPATPAPTPTPPPTNAKNKQKGTQGETLANGVKQMSQTWIDSSLNNIVGQRWAKIILAQGPNRIGIRVMADGSVVQEQITW